MSKILVIEDNMDIAQLLRDLLAKERFEVIVSYDGVQGTEFTHKHRPDLILLDLMLPAGGGFYVLEKIKLSMHTKMIPVVVLTASKDTTHRNKALEMGVNAFIEKPYDPQALVSTIRGLLGPKPKPQAQA